MRVFRAREFWRANSFKGADDRCKKIMRRSNTFSVPRAPGQSPAVPNQHAASVPVQQRTVQGSNENMLEMVKSLRKETKEIHSKLNLLEEQNKTILQELRKLQDTAFSVKGSSFEVCMQSHEAQYHYI